MCKLGSMCGRFSQSKPLDVLARRFRASYPLTNLEPRFNIAPTQKAPILRVADDGQRSISLVRWGLVPHWAKDMSIGAKMINARCETAAEKPGFRSAMKARRCLVLADGFYEWKKVGAKKQPWRFVSKDDEPFAMAGLWETWGPEKIETFTIITTTSNALVAPLHDRMPVVFPDSAAEDAWLSAGDAALLKPAPDEILRAFIVSDRVNNVRNDEPELIQEQPSGL